MSSNHELQAITGIWNHEIDEDLDSFNILPNPDKTDNNDPDLVLNIPTSNYHSLPGINRILNAFINKNLLSLFHFNIRSLSENFDVLNEFICSLNSRPDIIGLTETKLNKNSNDNTDLLGYKFYHRDSLSAAGGAALYVTKTISSEERKYIKFQMDQVESCWAEIHTNNSSKITIGSV